MVAYDRLLEHPHFKYRVAYAKFAGRLYGVLGADSSRTMFQHLLGLANDKVPNVKIVASNNLVQVIKSNKQLSSVVFYHSSP